MPALTIWLQQVVLALIPLLVGYLAYQTARRNQLPPTTTSSGTTLNGSFVIIRDCLDRLKALQTLYDREHARNIRLETQLEECQKRHAAKTHKPATPVLPDAPAASENGLAPTPRRSRRTRQA